MFVCCHVHQSTSGATQKCAYVPLWPLYIEKKALVPIPLFMVYLVSSAVAEGVVDGFRSVNSFLFLFLCSQKKEC